MKRLLLITYFILYAAAMMILGGATDIHKLYAPSPYHRLQADAFLNGRLNIADSIRQIGLDLAWHDGQINHVWGLGVGLWLTPFELVWRLFGEKWFPDRIALGVAFALLAWFAVDTGLRLSKRLGSRCLGIGFSWLIIFNPGMWTLNSGPRFVYEETSLYGYIICLFVLLAAIRTACFGGRWDFLVCAFLSGLTAIVRPPLGIYGVAAMLVGGGCCLARGRRAHLYRGCIIYIAWMLFLISTNYSRFGSCGEFGHRLTATPDQIIYTTRLGNSMEKATWNEAARELFESLFLVDDISRPLKPGESLVANEAPYYRWRDYYISTFSPSWLAMGCLGLLSFGLRTRAEFVAKTSFRRFLGKIQFRFSIAAMIFLVCGAGGLGFFYLRLPTFCSRYLLDFGPALTAGLALFWLSVPRRWATGAFLFLIAWIFVRINSIQCLGNPPPLLGRPEIIEQLPVAQGAILEVFHGMYDLGNPPGKTGIAFNGYGWDTGKGGVSAPIVSLAVDRPLFFELTVSPRTHSDSSDHALDSYNAVIDGKHLAPPVLYRNREQIIVRFELPQEVRRREGAELVFFWFAKDFEPSERLSERTLYSVRWR